MQNSTKSWAWYYPSVLSYYQCVQARIVVEVGAAFGSQAQYMLKNLHSLQEYHIVDPFLAGYDKEDPMSKVCNFYFSII